MPGIFFLETTAHETHLSAQQAQARTHPRLPNSHEEQRRTRHPEPPPQQGTQAPERLSLTARPLSLPRNRRLLTRRQFDSTMKEGRRHRDEYFTVYTRSNGLDHGRLGMTVSRRVSAAAVGRNRIRRQIRESFRLNQHALPGIDVVVMANSRAAAGDNTTLRQALNKHWKRLAS